MTTAAASSVGFGYAGRVFGDEDVIDVGQPSWGAVRMRRCLASLEGVTGSVLEIGCGAGRCIRTVARHRLDLTAHGCDLSQAAVTRARQHDDGVQYRTADATALPYEDRTFEAVMVMDLLEHVPDVAAVLTEVRRVSKPGARLHLHVPCEGSRLSVYRPLLALGIDLTRAAVGHLHHFTRREVLDHLGAAGFVVRRRRYSMYLFGQLHDLITWWAMPRRGVGLEADAVQPDAGGARSAPLRSAPGRFRWKHLFTRPAWRAIRVVLPWLQYVELALLSWQPLGAVGLCVTAERVGDHGSASGGSVPPSA